MYTYTHTETYTHINISISISISININIRNIKQTIKKTQRAKVIITIQMKITMNTKDIYIYK